MAMEDFIDSIKNFDPEQLNDINAVGSWPIGVKIIIWVLVFAGANAADMAR